MTSLEATVQEFIRATQTSFANTQSSLAEMQATFARIEAERAAERATAREADRVASEKKREAYEKQCAEEAEKREVERISHARQYAEYEKQRIAQEKRLEEEAKKREAERIAAAKEREEDWKKHKLETRKSEHALRDTIRRSVLRFDGQWGRLVEALVRNQLLPLLQARGIEVHDTARRRNGCVDGRNYEFDILAINGEVVVIVEVKTTLRPDAVTEFLDELSHAPQWLKEYQDKTFIGAVAFLQDDGNAAIMSQKQGLFTILATGSSAQITNNADFIPREWRK